MNSLPGMGLTVAHYTGTHMHVPPTHRVHLSSEVSKDKRTADSLFDETTGGAAMGKERTTALWMHMEKQRKKR